VLYSQSLSSLDGQDCDMDAAADDEDVVDAGNGSYRRMSGADDNVPSQPQVSSAFNIIQNYKCYRTLKYVVCSKLNYSARADMSHLCDISGLSMYC